MVQNKDEPAIRVKKQLEFDGARWIDEETGEAPDWEAIFAELEP